MNPERSQKELRTVLEQKLKSLKPTLQAGIKEYEQAMKDKIDEEAKEALQEKISAVFDRAEKMKARLDSKEALPQFTPDLSATYTHRDGKKETITMDIEAKLQDFTSFYQKTKVDLPPNFEDTIKDIWENHQAEIEQAIEQNGFNDMLIIPPTPNLKDLAEKMKMEKGYHFFQVKDDFSDVKSQNTDKPRIILYHKATLPEIQATTGLDVHLNITGADALKLYNANPDQYMATLEDFMILERKHFEDIAKHLNDWNFKSAHWLPGSKAGTRLVRSYWHPGARGLFVGADATETQYGHLGVRPTRCFF